MPRKTGERKLEILQTLAEMLQDPAGEKITTAALAARLDVSEAALYRHFPSKAKMFEGLIEFIEHTIFGVLNKITDEEQSGVRQLEGAIGLLLGFAEKNPGMTRVLTGDALVHEDPRLQARINQLYDRLEASMRQCIKIAISQGELVDRDVTAFANALLCYVCGRWHQFAKSGFKRHPAEYWALQKPLLIH